MKFKAFLTDYGVSLLERRFVPAFEKIGKTCHVYLTKNHFILLHNVLNADGVQSIAQFKKEVLFEDYKLSSQNEDRIAFTVDLSLFLRALKSSMSMDGDKLQVKLVKKRPTISERPMPYLTLESKGYRSAVVQDIPISQPLSRFDVQDLQSAIDIAQELPPTLVHLPDLHHLQNLVDRLKNVGDVLKVAVTKQGDLHLQVTTAMVSIGSEFRNLRVIGARVDNPTIDEASSPSERLQQALRNGEAAAVQVSMKHFVKGLHCHSTKPDAFFAGIAPNEACLLTMFQYFVPGTHQTDNSISLHCRLPVLDQA